MTVAQAFTLSQSLQASIAPKALQTLLTQAQPPTEEEIWTAVETDVGFVRRIAPIHGPIPSAMIAWAGRIRWLTEEIEAWTVAAPFPEERLTALLALARGLSYSGDLWWEMAGVVTPSPLFLKGLVVLARSRHLTMSPSDEMRDATRKLIAEFTDADRREAWDELDDHRPNVLNQVVPMVQLSGACHALSFLDPPSLVAATAQAPDLCTAYAMLYGLPLDAVAELAAATSSDRVRYVCAVRLTENRTTVLSAVQETRVADALTAIAADADRWRVWMRTCFTYPIRFACLHGAMGQALARIPQDRSDAYIDVLDPEDGNHSRALTAWCLETFAGTAHSADRQAVWARAYARWSAWDFGGMAGQTIVPSTLDFAVVAHMVEGVTPSVRRQARRDARQSLLRADREWRRNVSDMRRRLYTSASRLKPLTWAALVLRDPAKPWLEPLPLRLPRRFTAPYRRVRGAP